ncbi:CMP-N-acetylneuraminate-beta-galactosamide-alpha-2,3-sialyltransferase 1-like isoform X2 [Poecilia reticulata]|uniref:CMP-N-acetylneuraminate-beta-galactosamide- alpha-2,3-sialyltransferase 1-like isoform X2 n=1 Tax=Poecilia reticulata TaxID=8081 RepID=UPI0004A3BE51|nr:PREDICTED: CMP-N-acetylneuraminate-beta-galactosamide-alpha-2,3-sialyltransferase 1-like isoform X2 [Poecilia reticulata]
MTEMPHKSKNLMSRMKLQTKLFAFLLAITFAGVLLKSDWPQLIHQSLCGCFSRDILPFIRRVEPFLSANNNISEEAFVWWTRLQDEKRDFSYYKATINKLFEIFPPNPTFGKPSTGRIRTCAVVGNSVNLKGSGYGRLIDMNDAIIRMNYAEIRGYEADVGTKTTHHVMYPESAVDLDDSTHLVLFPFKIQDIEWLIKARTTGFYSRSYVQVKPKIRANNDLVMVISPAFMRYVHEVWLRKKKAYPSTGFMVLVAALHVCDQVNVFGFGADSDGNWSHYFGELINKSFKTGVHPGQEEYSVIQLLADKNSIKFYKGRNNKPN